MNSFYRLKFDDVLCIARDVMTMDGFENYWCDA